MGPATLAIPAWYWCSLGGLNRFFVQERRPVSMAMASPPDVDTTTFWLGAAATGALTFGVFRAVVYFNVQVRSPEFYREYSELYLIVL